LLTLYSYPCRRCFASAPHLAAQPLGRGRVRISFLRAGPALRAYPRTSRHCRSAVGAFAFHFCVQAPRFALTPTPRDTAARSWARSHFVAGLQASLHRLLNAHFACTHIRTAAWSPMRRSCQKEGERTRPNVAN